MLQPVNIKHQLQSAVFLRDLQIHQCFYKHPETEALVCITHSDGSKQSLTYSSDNSISESTGNGGLKQL